MTSVVLVGAGPAHLQVLAAARDGRLPGVRLTLVTPHARIRYSALLPATLDGSLPDDASVLDLEAICARAQAALVLAPAASMEPAARVVVTGTGARLPFDFASLNTGSATKGSEIPGVREHAVSVKPLETLLERLAERTRATGGGRVVIVGGGAAGVELALAVRTHGGVGAPVALVESEPRLLAGHAARAARLAESILRRRGVEVRLGVRVEAVEPDAVSLDGARWPAASVLWATGPAPQPWLRETGLALDDDGWIRVDATLRAVSSPAVFGAGDCVQVEGDRGARSGVRSVRQGELLVRNLAAAVAGRPLESWRPRRRVLALLSTADGAAIASWGPFAVRGRWVARWKRRIDARWMALVGG